MEGNKGITYQVSESDHPIKFFEDVEEALKYTKERKKVWKFAYYKEDGKQYRWLKTTRYDHYNENSCNPEDFPQSFYDCNVKWKIFWINQPIEFEEKDEEKIRNKTFKYKITYCFTEQEFYDFHNKTVVIDM